MTIKRKINIIDTTLRDGEQAPGVVFSMAEKIHICELLDRTGISEVEIGIPGASEADLKDITALVNRHFSFKSLVWARCCKKDIDAAILTKARGVHISMPVSSIQLNALGKDKHWVQLNLSDLVSYAQNYFEYVTVGAQDASRADYAFLKSYIEQSYFLNVSRIRIDDTVGIMNPFSVKNLFEKLIRDFPDMPFEFHGHNDLGMAVANTYTSLLTGAKATSVTVNGLGERAGNAALEEVVMALELSGKISTGLKTENFTELSCFVEKSSGRSLSWSKPVTGRSVLMHESGIHVQALIKDRNTYQIISPESIGTYEQNYVIGKHSGRAAVDAFFAKMGIFLTPAESNIIVKCVKEKAVKLKRALSGEEIINYYRNLKNHRYSKGIPYI